MRRPDLDRAGSGALGPTVEKAEGDVLGGEEGKRRCWSLRKEEKAAGRRSLGEAAGVQAAAVDDRIADLMKI